jgi:hypothetical protein
VSLFVLVGWIGGLLGLGDWFISFSLLGGLDWWVCLSWWVGLVVGGLLEFVGLVGCLTWWV